MNVCEYDGMLLKLKGWCAGVENDDRMVCEGEGMFNLHIFVRLLENQRKT